MYAYTGILTALMNRMKTGRGTVLEVSMLEALGEWMGYPAYYAQYGGKEPARTGASHSTIYPYGPFECGDGKTVFIGLQNEREWAQFCREVLNDESHAQDRSEEHTSEHQSRGHLVCSPLLEQKTNN